MHHVSEFRGRIFLVEIVLALLSIEKPLGNLNFTLLYATVENQSYFIFQYDKLHKMVPENTVYELLYMDTDRSRNVTCIRVNHTIGWFFTQRCAVKALNLLVSS